jgi:hypothetical protein
MRKFIYKRNNMLISGDVVWNKIKECFVIIVKVTEYSISYEFEDGRRGYVTVKLCKHVLDA